MYTSHENEKRTEYLPRVLQVEKVTFTPAVFSTSGGIGKEADALIRRMAERISAKSKDRRDLQQCSELPEKEIQVRPAKDVYNSAERLQEAIEHSSEDRDRAGHGCEGIRYILLRITDVICTDF